MQPLRATFISSLDLRVADAAGRFDWAAPTEEVHAFVNEQERSVGTYLYGRRMWDTMRFWLTHPADGTVSGDYAELWRAADKVVFSRTLEGADAPRTRVERRLDPGTVRALKEAATAPISIGGAELAGQAMRAGLVDQVDVILAPVVVGEGPRALPDGVGAALTLQAHRTFEGGWVHLSYAVGGAL